MILARLSLIAILALPLMAAKCTKEEIDHYSALLTGTPPAAVAAPQPVAFAALTVEPESSEEVVTVEPEAVAVVEAEPEVVAPTPEPVCDEWLFRGRWYDCHGNWLRDVE